MRFLSPDWTQLIEQLSEGGPSADGERAPFGGKDDEFIFAVAAFKVLVGPLGGEIKQVIGSGMWNSACSYRCLEHIYGS